jgi:hypothetical protein
MVAIIDHWSVIPSLEEQDGSLPSKPTYTNMKKAIKWTTLSCIICLSFDPSDAGGVSSVWTIPTSRRSSAPRNYGSANKM